MTYLNLELTDDENALVQAVAEKEGRSKREQFKRMAIEAARLLMPGFKYKLVAKSKQRA